MTPDEVVRKLKKLDKDYLMTDDLRQALQSAITLIQDYQKLREDFVGLDKFINDWLSKRHGIKYGGVLSKDLAQAIVTFLGCGDNLR